MPKSLHVLRLPYHRTLNSLEGGPTVTAGPTDFSSTLKVGAIGATGGEVADPKL